MRRLSTPVAWAVALAVAALLFGLGWLLGGMALGDPGILPVFAATVAGLGAVVFLSGLRMWGLRA
jgi:hypothetical protein